MLAYTIGAVAAAALAASVYISVKRPFRFKDNGSGPDHRPSAAVAGGLMTVALLGFVLAFRL
ncbi:hypothetical protein [Achromobacter animicus]|uniref:Uncharacterized protein n=1 Tax=Achromobacter animicus TaxID=1389935 RepID=A0A6S6ZGE0_9BURK|nr:hypothetical protein [Achromobacter animicus]CAB3676869.1 hypothetical protein LMG26690_01376 [Achromobacter animicus]CAB3863905.1 hypothetical protein LMG26691_02627 [Achromobacter animicus]